MADGGVVGGGVDVDPLQPYHQLPKQTPNVTTLDLRGTSYELRGTSCELGTLTDVSDASVT